MIAKDSFAAVTVGFKLFKTQVVPGELIEAGMRAMRTFFSRPVHLPLPATSSSQSIHESATTNVQ